jgi:hypothetical protein
MLEFDFLYESCDSFFLDKVDTQKMVFGFNSIIFGLFFRDSFDDG